MATSIHTYNRALHHLLSLYADEKYRYETASSSLESFLREAKAAAASFSLPGIFSVTSTRSETTGRCKSNLNASLLFTVSESDRQALLKTLAHIYLGGIYRAALFRVKAEERQHGDKEFFDRETDRAVFEAKEAFTPYAQYHLLADVFERKNMGYGDAWRNAGLIGVLVRLGDKLNRINTLNTHHSAVSNMESLMDSYLDAANYAVLATILLLPPEILHADEPPSDILEDQIQETLVEVPFPPIPSHHLNSSLPE